MFCAERCCADCSSAWKRLKNAARQTWQNRYEYAKLTVSAAAQYNFFSGTIPCNKAAVFRHKISVNQENAYTEIILKSTQK